jgi:hypothetical protein
MKAAKKKRLEAKGWTVGNSTEFLGLSTEEAADVELKFARNRNLHAQVDLFEKLGVAQKQSAAGTKGLTHKQMMTKLRRRGDAG